MKFTGNKDLCGKPLKPCKSYKKLILMIAITVGSVVVLGIIVAFCCIHGRSPQAHPPKPKQASAHKNIIAPSKKGPLLQAHTYKTRSSENEKLFFVRNDSERFEVQDLLKASAEILGSGNLGSSYKASLLNGPAMVVKRFRQMSNVGRDEFHEHMNRIGSFSHPNLLPLVAFYYRKEEKLLISDFVENGSLATHLHVKRGAGLDWPTRLTIIKGVARGMAYLYKELPDLMLPHGHLKSTNVLLDRTFQPLLTDYSLVPVVNKEHAHHSMVAYKSPENSRTTRKTDVWSLGILILEILTGKDPAAKQGKSGDLAAWVNSVVREEWTGEVFEKEMKGRRRGEGEMLKLLKIGMCCCEWREERRWDLRTAAEKIEDLKERDEGDADDVSSSFASEADFCSSSRAVTDDEFSFSVAASPV